MRKKTEYSVFDNYVLRSPILPFNFYQNLLGKGKVLDSELKTIFNDKVIKEALFLASPSLYSELEKWNKNEIKDVKRIEKLKITFLKYLTRMSTRCTPFGLFAGCSLGKFTNETSISRNGISENKRSTSLDMNYLINLSFDLLDEEYFHNQVLFYPNNSLYYVGGKLRYVEYRYMNGNRVHHIVETESTEYLKLTIEKCKKGETLVNLAKLLVSTNISFEEAYDYVKILKDNQIIVSDFEPSVSGPEFLDQMLKNLKNISGESGVFEILKEIKEKIKEIDESVGNDINKYIEVFNHLKRLSKKNDLKHVYQTNLRIETKENNLSWQIISEIKKGMNFLNKLNLSRKSLLFEKFKENFYKRFEDREVPLIKVLDPEIGIGYNQSVFDGDVNTLIDDLVFPNQYSETSTMGVELDRVGIILNQKFHEGLRKGLSTINLEDDHFDDFEANWDNLPNTFSSIIEIFEEKGKTKIKFNGFGGVSAANLLGRFCHSDYDINNFVEEIIAKENLLTNNKILAEIVHLPESRVGNILSRPALSKYEIPYLAKSLKQQDFQIDIQDLMVSLKNNTIILRSKKLNKEVIPKLSNSHNYHKNSLPIYHFLCDFQNQNLRINNFFNLGPLAKDYTYIPRVEYNNLVLHNAEWNLSLEHIKNLQLVKGDCVKLLIEVNKLRSAFNIPNLVLLVEGDNELLISLDNTDSVRMFLTLVKSYSKIKLKEFLHNEMGVVKNGNDYYTNQIVVSFFKN